MGAVARVVASGVELVRRGPDQGAVRREHLACAQQLVVALERRVVRVVGEVAEVARRSLALVEHVDWGRPVAPVVGETRMFGPDAGVDDADHDVLARQPAGVGAAGAGEAEELTTRIGGGVTELVGHHQRDVRGPGELDRFVVADDGGEAVERVRVVLHLVGVVDTGVGEHVVVRLLQHRRLCVGSGGVEVLLLDRCDERIGRHDHDVATGLALGDGLTRRIDDRFDRSGILLANTLLGSGCPDRYEQTRRSSRLH